MIPNVVIAVTAAAIQSSVVLPISLEEIARLQKPRCGLPRANDAILLPDLGLDPGRTLDPNLGLIRGSATVAVLAVGNSLFNIQFTI